MNKPFYFVIIVSVFVLAFLMNTSANWLEMQPTEPDRKFKVVDTYNNCDVIQYTPTNSARYSYFLHCNNTKPKYEQ
jgi:hypothetical protein